MWCSFVCVYESSYKMDKTAFPETNDAVTKLRNVLKCQICFELKSRNLVIYYKSCGHFFCTDCNKKEPSCTLCQTGKKELPLSLAKDDIKIAALYDKVLDLKLPARQEIEEIIKSQTEPLENAHLNPLENADDVYKISGAKKIVDKQKVHEPVKKVETNKRKSTENLVNTFSDVESKASDAKVAKNKSSTPFKTNVSFIKNSKGSTGKKKLNIRKTNCKGETLLHIAGKKGNLADMRELLDAGADINAKDAAGWTPLHDAVANGKMEVMMFLLENGANVNTPGFENNTALHEAVASGKIDACKVLMSYGADNKTINITGKTPLDMAREINVLSIVDVLLHTSASLNASSSFESKHDEVFKLEEGSNIWQCQLGKNQEKMVQKFADEFKCEVVSKYSYLMKGKLTHIIVPNDERITLNFFVLSSVFTGAIVTNYRWIEDCLNEKKILSVDEYLPKDEFYNGFKKCRASKTKGNPGLFNGCHFFFGGAFENYMVKDVKISKDHLKCIVEKNGGSILKRCPDPERTTEFTVPYHADEKTSIAKTCYFIIAQAGKWDPKPAYNMPHLKTLPIEWLVVCILNFQLVDPEETKLYMEKFFP